MKLRWEHVTTGNVWLVCDNDDERRRTFGGLLAVVRRQAEGEPWSVYAYEDGSPINPKTGRPQPMSDQGFTSHHLEEAKAWALAMVTLNNKDTP